MTVSDGCNPAKKMMSLYRMVAVVGLVFFSFEAAYAGLEKDEEVSVGVKRDKYVFVREISSDSGCSTLSDAADKTVTPQVQIPSSGFADDEDGTVEPRGKGQCPVCQEMPCFKAMYKLTDKDEKELLTPSEEDREFYKSKEGVVGAQSSIFLRNDFVIKQAKDGRELNAFLKEAGVLSVLQTSPESADYSVKLLGCCKDSSGKVVLFLERYEDDAFNFVTKTEKSDSDMRFLASQLALGLDAQAKHGIIHGDLKDMNILVNFKEDRISKVVLADYGYAYCLDCNTCRLLSRVAVNGVPHAAPELKRRKPHIKSDIWSFGVFLIECCFGGNDEFFSQPLTELAHSINNNQTLGDIEKDRLLRFLNRNDYTCFQQLCAYAVYDAKGIYEILKKVVNDSLGPQHCAFFHDNKGLIIEMLHHDPECRPSAEELAKMWLIHSDKQSVSP